MGARIDRAGRGGRQGNRGSPRGRQAYGIDIHDACTSGWFPESLIAGTLLSLVGLVPSGVVGNGGVPVLGGEANQAMRQTVARDYRRFMPVNHLLMQLLRQLRAVALE